MFTDNTVELWLTFMLQLPPIDEVQQWTCQRLQRIMRKSYLLVHTKVAEKALLVVVILHAMVGLSLPSSYLHADPITRTYTYRFTPTRLSI